MLENGGGKGRLKSVEAGRSKIDCSQRAKVRVESVVECENLSV